jgi:hypothetical protein
VASRAPFPNEPGFSWRNKRSQGTASALLSGT